MQKVLALLCHIAVLLTALHLAGSTSGFLITGVGLALLLDRYALRLLPWPPVAWKRELILRGACFLGGAAAFSLMRPGLVSLHEAAWRGVMVSLLAALLEPVVSLARLPRSNGWSRIWRPGIVAASLVLLVPVVAALHPLHTVPKRGPDAFGLDFEDVRFQTADGLELAAWLVPHPQARGNVIFCHGHGRNRGHVAGLLQTFHDLGLNVLAFDFRGHGDSQGHTSTFGHREVQDLLAAEAYFHQRCPTQPVLLVGTSLGAAVSLQALGQLPRVKGLWSEGAFARLSNVVDNQFAAVPDFLRRPLVDFYYLCGWLDCAVWGPSVSPLDQLASVRVPVFFCHGKEDELVPFSEGQALYEACHGPKEHWWVPGASHYNVRQRNHEEYLSRLRVFLECCLSRD